MPTNKQFCWESYTFTQGPRDAPICVQGDFILGVVDAYFNASITNMMKAT